MLTKLYKLLLGPNLIKRDWTVRHRALGVAMLLVPGIVVLFVDALLFLVYERQVMAVWPLIYAVVSVVLWLWLRRSARVSAVQTLVLAGLLPYFLYMVLTGGISGGSAFWTAVFPLIAFFFKGRRGGILWVGAMLGGLVLLVIGDVLDILNGYYDLATMGVVFAVMLVATAIMYVYETWRAEGERHLNDHARQLKLANDKLQSAQLQLEQLALHDSLTHLPNRAHFFSHLQAAMAHAERHGNRFAVLFLDLDGFKEVNDTYGHDVGDKLLATVATRLKCNVRTEDVVARLGGDEFAVLLSEVKEHNDANAAAVQLRSAIMAPYTIDGKTCHVDVSIGFSLFPLDACSLEEMMQLADAAMYRDKALHRDFQGSDSSVLAGKCDQQAVF